MMVENRILLILDGKGLTLSELAEELIIPSRRLSTTVIKLEMSGLLMRTDIHQRSAQLSSEENIDSYIWSRGY